MRVVIQFDHAKPSAGATSLPEDCSFIPEADWVLEPSITSVTC